MHWDGDTTERRVGDDATLAAELNRQWRAVQSVGPVLHHLVGNDDNPLFGEELIARTRGMLDSLARDLARDAGTGIGGENGPELSDALADCATLLRHCHALAAEGQAVQRLAASGVDPLLPPLVQARISDPDPDTATLAMTLMAAQTRFLRRQQRMELTLHDLPADLLAETLAIAARVQGPATGAAIERVRQGYDERRTRLAILTRLGMALGDDFVAALDPGEAGLSLFATAVSLMTGQSREDIVLATAPGQGLRLLLLLAIAGLAPPQRAGVMMRLHPDAPLPDAWLELDSHAAAELLARTGEVTG